MQKITPFLWFDKNLKEITDFYVNAFPGSTVSGNGSLSDTPSGNVEMCTLTIYNKQISMMTAGPQFKLNPSISLFVTFDNEADIESAWNKLVDGGTVLMAYDTYPWANKYGWLQDKYGLTWQLSWSDNHNMMSQNITPMMTFTQNMVGKVKEAIEFYTSTFPNSKTEMLVPYTKDEGDVAGYIKHARFILGGENFLAMESSAPHQFTFNEAFSFVINCKDQEEIDYYWSTLTADGGSESMCGWLKDKYGVSWQVVPDDMKSMMSSSDKEATARVVAAFMQMKKFDLATLRAAFEGR